MVTTLFFTYTLLILNNKLFTMSRCQRMHDALFIELTPETLLIDDESNRHHVPEGAESHIKIVAVSTHFNGMSRIARHRLVNDCLRDEFTRGLHALSLHLYTPDEWRRTSQSSPDSPACRGGKHHDEKSKNITN